MDQKKQNKQKNVLLIVLLLFICVALTTVAIVGLMGGFMPDDEGAISLIDDNKDPDDGSDGNDPDKDQTPQVTKDPAKTEVPSTTTVPPVTGFIAYDDQGEWKRKTSVEIFKISYENSETTVTVQSDDGDKLIAPGTENSYVFKLKNPGEVAMDYTVTIDAVFSPAEIQIPIQARLSRYDGKWITGSRENFDTVEALDAAKDNATLGAGRYTYYVLDWCWPYEGDTDELDTLLGNMATEQDLTFTITINTIARASDDPNAGGGIMPQTGDSAMPVLWLTLAGISLVLLIVPLIPVRRKRRDESEA